MLTSFDEAYTHYLERIVAGSDVDPAVVRATLHQLGYDEATIAVMMGETNGRVAALSESAVSTPVGSAQASLRDVGRVDSRSSASSVPSEMLRPPLHAQTPVERALGQGSMGSASPVQPPSIMHESKAVSALASTSSPATSATTSTARSDPPTAHKEGPTTSTTKSGDTSVQDDVRCPGSAGPALSSALPALDEQPAGVGCVDLDCSPFSPAEHAVLERWVQEYNALLLSSAMPRRATGTRVEVTRSRLPQDALLGACPSDPADEASSVDSVACDRGAVLHQDEPRRTVGVSARRLYDAGDCRVRHTAAAESDTSLSSSYASSGGCSGEATSSATSASSPGRPHGRPVAGGTYSAPRYTAGGAEEGREAPPRWYRPTAAEAALAASPPPFRHPVAKAKSALFIPSCGVAAPCQCGGPVLAECRHPYREAQDARLARSAHALASEVGHRPSSTSQSRARDVDAARERQHTSRAEPTGGRRIPLMQAPVRPSVHPRSGLSSGRQVSTLPPSARTDRVALAQSYRREWARHEQRGAVATRDASWDVRYALLSCGSALKS